MPAPPPFSYNNDLEERKKDMKKYLDTTRELLGFYVILIVLSAIGFSVVEHKPFIDSLWWSIVTAMTVGYGDIYPVTVIGKVIAVILMNMMVLFILPLLIGNICSSVLENRDAFTHEEQESIKRQLSEIKEKLKD